MPLPPLTTTSSHHHHRYYHHHHYHPQHHPHPLSPHLATTTGKLKLIQGAGSQTVALQWESTPSLAGAHWTTLHGVAVNGFTHGEELLVMVTSENAQPTIAIGRWVGE